MLKKDKKRVKGWKIIHETNFTYPDTHCFSWGLDTVTFYNNKKNETMK